PVQSDIRFGFYILPVLAAARIRQTAERAPVRAGVPAPSAAVQVADPHATGIHTWQGSSYLTVEGQNGLGPIIANAALAQIQERARHSGIAIAAVANAQHIGMLAWYAERVAREGQAAIVPSTRARLQHLADSPIQQQQYVRS
ncbi:MAG: Ldh family oxidoreductase, partial [Devosia sp.]|nr:Ldh family oxidoreductase [Devosia sp.]